jgi:hypothetical protein
MYKFQLTHKQPKAEAKKSPDAAPTQSAVARDLKHYQALMPNDLLKLKVIQDIAEKAVLKKVLLEKYQPFIEQYLTENHCYPNTVAIRVMIWAFDVGNVDFGTRLGLVLAKQKCHQMPQEFNRSIERFLCDMIYDWSAEELKKNRSASPYLDDVAEQVSTVWDLDGITSGKVYAMLAKHQFRLENWAMCMLWADKAESVNPGNAGCKTIRNKAQAMLSKMTAPE